MAGGSLWGGRAPMVKGVDLGGIAQGPKKAHFGHFGDFGDFGDFGRKWKKWKKCPKTVPTGRVIKYPKKCTLFSSPGFPGGAKVHPPGGYGGYPP